MAQAASPGLAGLIAAAAGGGGAGGERRAVSDSARNSWSYDRLVAEAAAVCARLRAHRPSGVLLLQARQSAPSVAALLGGWAAGYQVILSNGSGLADTFVPEAVADDAGLKLVQHGAPAVHPAPGLLLSTSGTTGSSKLVRLSLDAVIENARQIVEALRLNESDVGLVHLPLQYSYGLSVLTSHLEAGAAAHLIDGAFTQPEFWTQVAEAGATHLPGVPFHYAFLARGALKSLVPPCVTTFTQAGGALAVPVRQRIHEAVCARGGRFYVMYGQTEAAPRISTLDHDDFPAYPESVGRALRGGHIHILDEEGGELSPGEEGAVHYSGPNLMAGYAVSRSDLIEPDTPLPSIATGDRGVVDESGILTLKGRNQGFAKIGGLRLSLDDLAAKLAAHGDVALLPGDEKIHVFHAGPEDLKPPLRDLAIGYALPASSFQIHAIESIPRHASGKIDYQQLKVLIG